MSEKRCPVTELRPEEPVNTLRHYTKPYHYDSEGIDVIDFCNANSLSFTRGNIIKYTVRAGAKLIDGMTARESAIVDLEKAKEYINREIESLRID